MIMHVQVPFFLQKNTSPQAAGRTSSKASSETETWDLRVCTAALGVAKTKWQKILGTIAFFVLVVCVFLCLYVFVVNMCSFFVAL